MYVRTAVLFHTFTQTAGEHSTAHLHTLTRTSLCVQVPYEHYSGLTHLMLSACTPYAITTANNVSNIRCGLAIQVANAHGHSMLSYTRSSHHLYTLVALRFNALLGVCIYHVTPLQLQRTSPVISGWQTYQHEPYHRLPRCLPGQPSLQSRVIVAASISHPSLGERMTYRIDESVSHTGVTYKEPVQTIECSATTVPASR